MSDHPVYTLHRGSRPLLLSMPHVGTHIPATLKAQYSRKALALGDTDWHLTWLYEFARAMDVSLLVATHSRYVIDLNRPPENYNLYPGQDTTGLCPVDDFEREPLYVAGKIPDETEITRRRDHYWMPYHRALQDELARLRERHGQLVLWDAHSIRSVVPRFFEGKLPDFNFGTNSTQSCSESLAQDLMKILKDHATYSSVLNGRFKGGYITRHYGNPVQGIHAVQLEMAQSCYMQEEFPFTYRPELANKVSPVLEQLLQVALKFVEQ